MAVIHSFQRFFINNYKISLTLSLALMLIACAATMPPVQEMSDARQAIKAARDARAEHYAAQKLRSAEDSMELATRTLEQGEYEAARMAAIVAKALAIKAKDEAIAAAP